MQAVSVQDESEKRFREAETKAFGSEEEMPVFSLSQVVE